MTKILLYVSDNLAPEFLGGAELVDRTITERLGCDKIKSAELREVNQNTTYIISNMMYMDKGILNEITNKCEYFIIEHDYKIARSRRVCAYPNHIIPESERTNYEYYKNAKMVFVQSTDHLEGYTSNHVPARFFNFNNSIWSEKELSILEKHSDNTKSDYRFAIVNSNNGIKNTKGAIDFCTRLQLDYSLIHSSDWETFLEILSKHAALVFLPIVRESYCRLVMEARCLNMNVITTQNYGAVKEPSFKMRGKELIEFLRVNSERNLQAVENIVCS